MLTLESKPVLLTSIVANRAGETLFLVVWRRCFWKKWTFELVYYTKSVFTKAKSRPQMRAGGCQSEKGENWEVGVKWWLALKMEKRSDQSMLTDSRLQKRHGSTSSLTVPRRNTARPTPRVSPARCLLEFDLGKGNTVRFCGCKQFSLWQSGQQIQWANRKVPREGGPVPT